MAPTTNGKTPRRPPARSIADRENQLIAKSYDLAEKQIDDGTASSQVLTHFLKMGTIREELERERIHNENLLRQAQIVQIESAARIEILYKDAMDSMRRYSGESNEDDEDGYAN